MGFINIVLHLHSHVAQGFLHPSTIGGNLKLRGRPSRNPRSLISKPRKTFRYYIGGLMGTQALNPGCLIGIQTILNPGCWVGIQK